MSTTTISGRSAVTAGNFDDTAVLPCDDKNGNTRKVTPAQIRTQIVTPEAWTAPSLQNSWINFGGTTAIAGYYKGQDGVVHIRGLIKNGTATAGTNLFILPAGYRPVGNEYFACASHGTFAEVTIAPTGEVDISLGGAVATYLSLCGISFRTT